MTGVVNSLRTNVSADLVASNLSKNSASILNARTKVMTGTKLVQPLSDVGNFSMTSRLASAAGIATSTHQALQNMLSFAQAQEDSLQELSSIFTRMNEVVSLMSDAVKQDVDVQGYSPELRHLADEVVAIGQRQFNGQNLFTVDSTNTYANVPGSVGTGAVDTTLQTVVSQDGQQTVSVTLYGLQGAYEVSPGDTRPVIQNIVELLYSGDLANNTDSSIASLAGMLGVGGFGLDIASNLVNGWLAKNGSEQAAIQSSMASNAGYADALTKGANAASETDLAAETSNLTKLSLVNESALSAYVQANWSTSYLLGLL